MAHHVYFNRVQRLLEVCPKEFYVRPVGAVLFRLCISQDPVRVIINNLQISVTSASKCLFLAHEKSSVNVAGQAAFLGSPFLR